MLVALAAAVARRGPPLLAGPQPVPHVVGEHAVLDEDVAGGRPALVVDGERAPLAAHGAVVDQRDQGAGHQLADLADVDRGVLHDVVGLEPVPAGLVEEDPPAPTGQHDGQLAGRRRAGRQLGQGPAGRRAGHLLDVDAVEELEALGAGDGLEARSACRCRPVATHDTVKRVRTWSSSASTPSVLATRIRRRLSP